MVPPAAACPRVLQDIFSGLPLGFCEVFSFSMGYHPSEDLSHFLAMKKKCDIDDFFLFIL